MIFPRRERAENPKKLNVRATRFLDPTSHSALFFENGFLELALARVFAFRNPALREKPRFKVVHFRAPHVRMAYYVCPIV
jgi:hypothetical protein